MNYLDLFAGAGGLSEGFLRAGFSPIAHVEMDKHAAESLKTRAAFRYFEGNRDMEIYRKYQKSYGQSKETRELAKENMLKYLPIELMDSIINITIKEETLVSIFEKIDNQMKLKKQKELDMIIGGPPCQAYSLIGRSRDNIGKKDDPRNYLYLMYARFLKKYRPKAFVFENVPGIYTANKGAIFEDIQLYFRNEGYKVKTYNLNASMFNVPQNRKRVIIIGFREDFDSIELDSDFKSKYKYSVIDILDDLPKLQAGESHIGFEYETDVSKLLKNLKIRNEDDILTHHEARTHNSRDLKIYRNAVEMWNNDKRRIKYNDLPENLITHKNKSSFLDRFKVVAGDLNFSHTIMAHISKDGHHYIHPDSLQNRSLTVREAARLQSFPDDYFFEGPRTANYIQIGNAVPPLMAEGIARWLKKAFSCR
ncbi:MAG TPA: DNA (cytosine-5-)-methyltransferase [Clostridiales bacterium]|nr:DNA (cytosine-5-)-methyltransferase [Clostridiales bacterium]